MSLGLLLGIAACGGVGAVVRFVLDTVIKRTWQTIFPFSTLIINTLAGFAFACALLLSQNGQSTAYLLITSGFLGGLSTFSTAINEIFNLARDHHWKQSVLYLMLAVLVPVIAIMLGIAGLIQFAGLTL